MPSAAACVSLCLLLAAAAVAPASPPLDLPENFTKCRSTDPKLNECLRRAVPEALRLMKNGVEALGVAPLEPLAVRAVDIDSGAGAVRIQQNYRHILLHGLTDSTLKYYKADLKHYKLVTESLTPVMQFVGDYVMKGRILLLPIYGKGRANITLVRLSVEHELSGEPVEREGELYMHIRDYRVLFTPQRVHMHFDNLFNGDKLLGEQMNKFLNENSELVFNELKSSYEQALSRVFRDIANKFFDNVPLNTIFPAQ